MEALERLVARIDENFWAQRRVLVTGHTGFKGAWLSFWLHRLGAKVYGLALAPTDDKTAYNALKVPQLLAGESFIDIRDLPTVNRYIENWKPDLVLHLAAQSLVRKSYVNPIETFSTNVLGTANLLEACRTHSEIRAFISVTSDKCYENVESDFGYEEEDRLGGFDPYSTSKACAELVSACYRRSFGANMRAGSALAIATARAGNVIGGGDWAEDRIIPDLMRAIIAKKPLVLRNPAAIRPWQHVLEPLSGYLLLAERIYQHPDDFASAWNFGPGCDAEQTVEWIVKYFAESIGSRVDLELVPDPELKETKILRLNSSKAKKKLGWAQTWSIEKTVLMTACWYRAFLDKSEDLIRFTNQQIDHFEGR